MKDYQKPDVEYVSLLAEEMIASDLEGGGGLEGEEGLESSIFG